MKLNRWARSSAVRISKDRKLQALSIYFHFFYDLSARDLLPHDDRILMGKGCPKTPMIGGFINFQVTLNKLTVRQYKSCNKIGLVIETANRIVLQPWDRFL